MAYGSSMLNADGTKTCPRCGEAKPAGDSFYRTKRKSGDGYAGYCIPCAKQGAIAWMKAHPEKNAARMRAHRAAQSPVAKREQARTRRKYSKRALLVAELKARPCMDCGVQYPAPVMELDHREPLKKSRKYAAPGHMAHSTTWEAFLQEVAKCDVVCANCHRMRTHRRRTEAPAS